MVQSGYHRLTFFFGLASVAALDNGIRSPRRLLPSVVRKLLLALKRG